MTEIGRGHRGGMLTGVAASTRAITSTRATAAIGMLGARSVQSIASNPRVICPVSAISHRTDARAVLWPARTGCNIYRSGVYEPNIFQSCNRGQCFDVSQPCHREDWHRVDWHRNDRSRIYRQRGLSLPSAISTDAISIDSESTDAESTDAGPPW